MQAVRVDKAVINKCLGPFQSPLAASEAWMAFKLSGVPSASSGSEQAGLSHAEFLREWDWVWITHGNSSVHSFVRSFAPRREKWRHRGRSPESGNEKTTWEHCERDGA